MPAGAAGWIRHARPAPSPLREGGHGAAPAILLSPPSPSRLAREAITVRSDVTLLTDGTVDVTETIEVNAEGIEIRRGIFRDIPDGC